MKIFKNYQQNLKYDNKFIYSYNTKVAKIDWVNKELWALDWRVVYRGKLLSSSPTTRNHINYASKELNLELKTK